MRRLAIILLIAFFSCGNSAREIREIRPVLNEAWERSNYGASNQIEQGGVIVESNNKLRAIRFQRKDEVPQTLNGFGDFVDQIRSVYKIRFIYHTHPFKPGIPLIWSTGKITIPRTDRQHPSGNDYRLVKGDELGLVIGKSEIVIHNRNRILRRVRRK